MNNFAVLNEKGGTGKSITAVNLSAGLMEEGKRVLIADIDPQASATLSLGFRDEYPISINDVFKKRIQKLDPLPADDGIPEWSLTAWQELSVVIRSEQCETTKKTPPDRTPSR